MYLTKINDTTNILTCLIAHIRFTYAKKIYETLLYQILCYLNMFVVQN